MSQATATRDAFGVALKEIGAENSKVVALDADLSCSTKSAVFAKAFPERFFQMGIAEANMISTAAGMSFTGLVPFICSFGCFLAGRYETIRVSIGYSKANVKMVGTHAGLGIGPDGYTQMGLEDVATLRSLPGMAILQPSDGPSTHAAVRFAAEHVGPVYLRLTRQKLPTVHPQDFTFKFGQGVVLREGGDQVALLGTGSMVAEALTTADILKDHKPWVVDFHTLKPIDAPLIRSLAQSVQHIVTLEDHNIIGGLGSAVAEVLAEAGASTKLHRIGLQDVYGESGDPKDLYNKYGFSGEKIAESLPQTLGL